MTQVSPSPSRGTNAFSCVCAGRSPGVSTRTTAGRSTPAACRNLGINPARNNDDLPLPEGPNTAAHRCSRTRSTSSATSASRPKNRPLSSASKRASPR